MAPSYVFVVRGQIAHYWASWFEGLTITYVHSGDTMLYGSIVDQAALYGVLNRIRDFGLALIEVRLLGSEMEGDQRALTTTLIMLDGLVARALAAQRHQSSIRLLVQRAVLREVQAERVGALQDLEQALALAAPEGFKRSFLDHGPLLQPLLQATQATGLGSAYLEMLIAGS
ncbi:MAG: hypothetical protein AB4911_04900 [Oscillochloridaceae bacterium umkhey_bin13]